MASRLDFTLRVIVHADLQFQYSGVSTVLIKHKETTDLSVQIISGALDVSVGLY